MPVSSGPHGRPRRWPRVGLLVGLVVTGGVKTGWGDRAGRSTILRPRRAPGHPRPSAHRPLPGDGGGRDRGDDPRLRPWGGHVQARSRRASLPGAAGAGSPCRPGRLPSCAGSDPQGHGLALRELATRRGTRGCTGPARGGSSHVVDTMERVAHSLTALWARWSVVPARPAVSARLSSRRGPSSRWDGRDGRVGIVRGSVPLRCPADAGSTLFRMSARARAVGVLGCRLDGVPGRVRGCGGMARRVSEGRGTGSGCRVGPWLRRLAGAASRVEVNPWADGRACGRGAGGPCFGRRGNRVESDRPGPWPRAGRVSEGRGTDRSVEPGRVPVASAVPDGQRRATSGSAQ